MKLARQYEDIKTKIIDGLSSKSISLDKLKSYFKDIQEFQVDGDFNRACVWVGSELNKLWSNELCILYKYGVHDSHVKTLYRRFFKELQFN